MHILASQILVVEYIETSEHLTKFAEKTNNRTPVLHYIYCNK